MIGAVVFDRDDVLTYFDLSAAARYFAPLLPLPLPELAARWQTYGGQAQIFRSAEAERPFLQAFWSQLCAEFQLGDTIRAQLHAWDYTTIMRAHPDAAAALQRAKALGLATGVLSNFELPSIDYSLEVVGLASQIDIALTSTAITARKPAARAYQAIAAALQVAPHECLFFDNLPACVAGARQVGMQAYLVDRTRTAHELANTIVCDLAALEAILSLHPR